MAELIARWPWSTPSRSLQSNLKGWIQSRALNSISEVWASADHFTAGFSDSDSGEFHQRDAELIRSVLKLLLREITNWFCSQKKSVTVTSRERLKWISIFWPLCPKRPSVMKASLPLCCTDTNRPGFEYSCTDNAFPMQILESSMWAVYSLEILSVIQKHLSPLTVIQKCPCILFSPK